MNLKYRKKINLAFFLNNLRGYQTIKFFSKKKEFKIKQVFLAKKNLNKKIINKLKKYSPIILTNPNKKIYLDLIKKDKIDFNLVCGFPYIFKESLIKSPKFKTLNMHAGKLPEYRGGSPLNWQIINGEKFIFISIIILNKGIDTGDIIAEEKFRLKESFDIKDVHNLANKKFPKILIKSIFNILENPNQKYVNQNEKKAKYYKQRKEKDGKINFNKKAKDVLNFVRALTQPYPCAYAYSKSKKKIKIIKVKKTNISLKKKEIIGKTNILNNKVYINCKDKKIELLLSVPKVIHEDILNQ